MGERGEFTRKFDREILGDDSAEAEEREAQRLLILSEDQAVQAEFDKVVAILAHRSQWLQKRFPGRFKEAVVNFRGERFEFSDSKGNPVGSIEFRTRLTDSKQGISIESFMELEGQFPRRHDYVNFPKEKVNLERAKRFVESKLMEFAGPYQDVYGA